jgi:molecular chaperone Hsp33
VRKKPTKENEMFQDYLFYGTDVETRYAFRMVHLTALARHAQSLHELNAPRAEILGQGLLAGVLLASILEDEERINLRIQASGDFTLGIETTRHAVTRGYLECNSESEIIGDIDAGGKPQLPWVIRSLRSKSNTNKLFEGITGTETHLLETALNEHLAASYQMKCKLKVDCWHNPTDNLLYAVGVIYLELPNLNSETSSELWSHVNALPPLRSIFGNAAHDPDLLAPRLIPHQVRAINSLNPTWGCSCSQESVEHMLKQLGRRELMSLADEKKSAEIRCHYCNKFFSVDEPRLRELAAECQPSVPSPDSSLIN